LAHVIHTLHHLEKSEKSMLLKTIYKDGQIRFTNLHESFFEKNTNPVKLNEIMKEKTLRLCADHGVYKKVELFYEDNLILKLETSSEEIPVYNKSPEEFKAWKLKKKQKERIALKRLKEKLINPVFTVLAKSGNLINIHDVRSFINLRA
jgi:hypothetical protein